MLPSGPVKVANAVPGSRRDDDAADRCIGDRSKSTVPEQVVVTGGRSPASYM
jgi:hypothetical protein